MFKISMKIELDSKKIFVNNGIIKHEIHPFWLRERVSEEEYLDQRTQQRLFDPSLMNHIVDVEEVTINGDYLNIVFNDGVKSKFEIKKITNELSLNQESIIDIKKTKDYFSKISEIINNNDVSSVVVGLPLTLKGMHSKQTETVLSFIDQLKNKINLPVITIDERLSSLAAEKSLIDQGVKTGHNKALIDETAAAIFLQEHLDSLI